MIATLLHIHYTVYRMVHIITYTLHCIHDGHIITYYTVYMMATLLIIMVCKEVLWPGIFE